MKLKARKEGEIAGRSCGNPSTDEAAHREFRFSYGCLFLAYLAPKGCNGHQTDHLDPLQLVGL
jgi:hypothetical protein